MRVLIAEDDAGTRRLLEKTIRCFGHEVISAADGLEAWDAFANGSFGFILTDWMMPGLDGLELCRRVRAAGRPDYVFIIMVTACSGQDEFIAGMEAGADEFIVKPINPKELEVRMRAAERSLGLQQELREKNQQLELVNTRLQLLSRLDPLMQIGNRLAFEERIADFHHRATRYGSPYAVIMCDLDHFKHYNDAQGHLAGDEVLRRIADAMKCSLRTSDAAFRYGGDEIVILLPEQGMGDATVMAERLRTTIDALHLAVDDPPSDQWLTISCGISAYPADGCQLESWDAVVEWADQALYRAKALGRNRVEIAELCMFTPPKRSRLHR